MSYCVYAPTNDLHKQYHDTEYGFPVDDDEVLFERMILEINQAGLSWDLMLKKRANFRKAYANFKIDRVARFDENDIGRLMNDAGIIRNRLKIMAAIHNAQVIRNLQKEHGSFASWIALQAQTVTTREAWVKLFKKQFRFMGGEIVGEFLMSIGILPGAHDAKCPVFQKSSRSRM